MAVVGPALRLIQAKKVDAAIATLVLTDMSVQVQPSELAQLAYALASSGMGCPPAFTFRARCCPETSCRLRRSEEFFVAAATETAGKMRLFKPSELAVMAWSVSMAPVLTSMTPVHILLTKVAGEIDKTPEKFDFEALAHVVFGFAKLGIGDAAMFRDVATLAVCATMPHIGADFAKAATNMLWAFSSVGVHHRGLYTRVGGETLDWIPAFAPKQLAMLAWAFAKAEIPDPKLFEAIGASAAGKPHA